MKCHRCKQEYDKKAVRQYAWSGSYCSTDCFLGIKPSSNAVQQNNDMISALKLNDGNSRIIHIMGDYGKSQLAYNLLKNHSNKIHVFSDNQMFDSLNVMHKEFLKNNTAHDVFSVIEINGQSKNNSFLISPFEDLQGVTNRYLGNAHWDFNGNKWKNNFLIFTSNNYNLSYYSDFAVKVKQIDFFNKTVTLKIIKDRYYCWSNEITLNIEM